MEMVPAYPNDGSRLGYLALHLRAAQTRFVWCLVLDAGVGIPSLVPERGESALTLHFTGGGSLALRDGAFAWEEHP